MRQEVGAMTGQQPISAGLTLGWCQVPEVSGRESAVRRWVQSVREDAAGYVAMILFLFAYALMMSGAEAIVHSMLNLVGSAIAGTYLYRKGAMPNVILNVAWAGITIAWLITR